MNYEQWLDNIKAELRKRYKIKSITEDRFGVNIAFETNYHYQIWQQGIEKAWADFRNGEENTNNYIHSICFNIEKKFLDRIMR